MQTHIFNSQIPVTFREDGFLNATAIAAHFGKVSKDFLKNQQTQEYIAALAEFLSKGRKIPLEQNQIVIVKKGGNDSGTWIHPKLAVHFARWLDARFAVWCDMKIEEILGINQNTKISPAQKQAIRESVQERHHRTGEHWQEIYKKLHSFLKVNSYHEIEERDFQTALDFLASIENAPAKPEPKMMQFTEQEISQFAVVTYYLDKATRQLKDLSEPLKAIGARQQGVEAGTLWLESQSWLRHSRAALERIQPQIKDNFFREHTAETLYRMDRLACMI